MLQQADAINIKREREKERVHTLTASTSSLTGSCS